MSIIAWAKRAFKQGPKVTSLHIALAGDNVECVCCSKTFITFLPYGLVKRPNALCPFCSSLERHRLHWHYITHNTNIQNLTLKIKLLHIAPEEIFYNKFINNNFIEYFPAAKFGGGFNDVYPLKTINIDITAINFPDDYFDVIYCSHVLEHIEDDHLAMTELHRVLKPGGWALLQVPIDRSRTETYEDASIIDPLERQKKFGQVDHVRVYGTDYLNRLVNAGFTAKEENYTEKFTTNEIFRFGFMVDEHIYCCKK